MFWKKHKKRKFLRRQIEKFQRVLWSLEIKEAATKEIREGLRIQYDKIAETIDAEETRIKLEKEKEKTDMELVKKLIVSIEKYKVDLKTFDDGMKGCDIEIDGMDYKDPETQEPMHKDGVKGKQEAAHETMVFVKKLLKKV